MKPILKWAGGKTQLLPVIRELMPSSFNRYFEPFIGGAAVLLALEPRCAIVNDINPELVNLYRQVKDAPGAFMAALEVLDASHERSGDAKAHFYEVRDAFNANLDTKTPEQAARLVFLNKHCFNGLYRVNAKGFFNVPFNNKKSGRSFERGNVLEVSAYLQQATILEGDFENAVREAKERDFVFFDSPYAPLNPESFTDYTKEGFALEDHRRLARLFRDLASRGVLCMLTNHDTPLIRELYQGFPQKVVPVARHINANGDGRMGEEVIVTSYEPEARPAKTPLGPRLLPGLAKGPSFPC